MNKGWHILTYHDVSWEESPHIRGIGEACPPDIFREHLACLTEHGELVSVGEGLKRYRNGRIEKPLFSFWFDHGLRGVRKYAWPLMEKYGVTGAISVSSSFLAHKAMFWHFKLSLLSQVDGMRFLRSRLRKHGYPFGMSVHDFVFNHIGPEILEEIDAVYETFMNEIDRMDAFRVFDDVEGLKRLRESGWEIANQTAAHRFLSKATAMDQVVADFDECEEEIGECLGEKTSFWVLPFHMACTVPQEPGETCLKGLRERTARDGRSLVLMGDKINMPNGGETDLVQRIAVPTATGKDLVAYLEKLS